MIRLSGLEPGKDIEIVTMGIRPGEKLSEDLWDEGLNFAPTAHPDINKVESDDELTKTQLDETVSRLMELSTSGDKDKVVQFIEETIPGAKLTHEALDLTAIT